MIVSGPRSGRAVCGIGLTRVIGVARAGTVCLNMAAARSHLLTQYVPSPYVAVRKHTLGSARYEVPRCARTEKRIVNPTMRTAVIGLGALILWISGGGIAAAHTALTSSDPAKDATVTASPGAIVLTFNEDINPSLATIGVSSADGRNWVSGASQGEGPRLKSVIGPDRPGNGVYTVGYRVLSADGHPVTGSYTFTIAGVPDESPNAPTAAIASPDTETAAPSSAAPAGADTKTSVLSAAAAGLALGGVIVFWQSRKHRRQAAAAEEAPRPTPPVSDNDAT